jgi:hypothetical protein
VSADRQAKLAWAFAVDPGCLAGGAGHFDQVFDGETLRRDDPARHHENQRVRVPVVLLPLNRVG